MALNRHASFRQGALALTTAAAIAMGGSLPAAAQTVAKSTSVNAPSSPAVSAAQCATFGGYVLDESDAFGDKLSATFLNSVSRFVAAKCATRDDKGEIQIIVMTTQDAASLRTARGLMGKFDILGISGVNGCARPANGVCPARTGANAPRIGGG